MAVRRKIRRKRIRRPRLQQQAPISIQPQNTPAIPDITQNNIIELQRTIGNQAVQRLLNSDDIPPNNSGVTSPLITNFVTPRIQRTTLSELQEQLESAKTAFARKQKGSRAWTKLNNKIKRLENEISNKQTSNKPEPEEEAEPFKKKYPTLANHFKESEIENLETTITEKRLSTLAEAFPATLIKQMIDVLTMDKFADLVSVFNDTEVDGLKTTFNPNKLKDLLSVYDSKTLKIIFGKIDKAKISEVLDHITASKFDEIVKVTGTTKMVTLLATWDIGGAALKHYSADFLKVFNGAGSHTMNHLLTIRTKGNGVISGGHDAAVFYPEINRVINQIQRTRQNGTQYTVTITNGRVTQNTPGSTYDVVKYRTNRPNGSRRAGGKKTLIHNLQAQQAAWLKKANEAVWGSVKAKTFPEDGSTGWSGTSKDGVFLRGYYTPSQTKAEIATFFPV